MDQLCNDKLHKLYSSSNIVRVVNSRTVRLSGYVTQLAEAKFLYNYSLNSWQEEMTWQIKAYRQENNSKIYYKEIRYKGVDWIYSDQGMEDVGSCKRSKEQDVWLSQWWLGRLLCSGIWYNVVLYLEDGGGRFLQNVSNILTDCIPSYPRRQ